MKLKHGDHYFDTYADEDTGEVEYVNTTEMNRYGTWCDESVRALIALGVVFSSRRVSISPIV